MSTFLCAVALSVGAQACSKETGEAAEQTAQSANADMERNAANAGKAVRQGTQEAVNEADRVGERVGNAAANAAENVREGAREMGNDIREGTNNAANDIREGTREAAEDTREGARRAGDRLDRAGNVIVNGTEEERARAH